MGQNPVGKLCLSHLPFHSGGDTWGKGVKKAANQEGPVLTHHVISNKLMEGVWGAWAWAPHLWAVWWCGG